MKQVERICQMEELFNFALNAMKKSPMSSELYAKTKQAIDILSSYYNSDEWRQDYADDEAGLFTKELKRGVLSEDGLWNLLSDWKELTR